MKRNPALEGAFKETSITDGEVMTLKGTIIKTLILTAILLVSASITYLSVDAAVIVIENYIFLMLGLIGIGLMMKVSKKMSPFLSIIYAIVEGLFLGGISLAYEVTYGGIVQTAVYTTMNVFVVMLVLYMFKIIKPSERFNSVVRTLTISIAFIYLSTFLLGLFGVDMPFIHDTGTIGIGISLFVVIVASLNLISDFDYIEYGVSSKQAKYMEWYAAFSLLVTIIWLYINLLRLLSKLRRD